MRYTDVFEHGIEVRRGEDMPPPGLLRVATDKRGVHTGFVFEVVDPDGTFPNYRAMKLAMVQKSHRHKDFYEERDIRYCLGNALYHLNRVIEFYVAKRRQFEKNVSENAIRVGGSEPRLYYEVEAFFGAARRIYEAISKLLWKHYAVPRNMNGRWRSIDGAINSDVVPDSFVTSLRQSLDLYGETLTAYRDFIMHTAPLTDGVGACSLRRIEERWGLKIPLPTNPEKKVRRVYDVMQGDGPDALSYCYGVAVHMVALCEGLMALPEIAHHIANPPSIG